MTPSSETEIWGGLNGKVVALGIVVICPIDKNRDHYTKNLLFGPNIQIFGSNKHIFAVAFSSKNQDFLPKNDQIWPEIGIFVHFGPGLAHLVPCWWVGWWLYLARHLFTLCT